ncbi:MAG: hypothetical protein IKO19_07690 [Candidatus Riflebacteria bacterium]|nr:hypothetical protein [Candidatus Riflebacteria bacterium]
MDRKKIIKIIVLIILFFISYFFINDYISSDFKYYYEECEKCIDAQKKINEAILKYKNNDTNLENILEDDSRLSIKTLHDKGYLKELVLGVEKECDFRYDTNSSRLYCVKHGESEFVKNYSYYKERDEQDNSLYSIYLTVDIIFLLFAIFW